MLSQLANLHEDGLLHGPDHGRIRPKGGAVRFAPSDGIAPGVDLSAGDEDGDVIPGHRVGQPGAGAALPPQSPADPPQLRALSRESFLAGGKILLYHRFPFLRAGPRHFFPSITALLPRRQYEKWQGTC